mgnify:FL=1
MRSAAILPLMLLTACPPPELAQRALSVTSHVLVELDEVSATAYTNAHEIALIEADSREQYDRLMDPYDSLERSLRVAAVSLHTSQQALLAWQQGSSQANFRAMLPGLLDALNEVLTHLEGVGVDAPDELYDAIRMLSGLLEDDNE